MMNESHSSQDCALTLATRSQKVPGHKNLGFHTAFGTEWFEFSPEKMKDYFYELGAIMVRHRYADDISFSSALEMSSLNIDEFEDQPLFGSSLCAMLDCKVKDDARADLLRRVCGYVLNLPEYELLRYQVNELVGADLVAARVTYNPEANIYLKVRLYRISLHSPTFIKA
jgi:hypothetical protein